MLLSGYFCNLLFPFIVFLRLKKKFLSGMFWHFYVIKFDPRHGSSGKISKPIFSIDTQNS